MSLSLTFFLLFALGTAASATDWSETKRQLVSGSPMEQQEAMTKFGKGNRTAVPVLIGIIKEEKDSMAKARSGEALMHLLQSPANRAPSDIPILSALADSDDRYVARSGLEALSNFKGDEQAKDCIRRAIVEKKDDFVRAPAIGWLSKAAGGEEFEAEFLKKLLKDKSDLIKVRAASSLGRAGRTDGTSVVLEILRRSPSRAETMIMAEAALAAGEIGDHSAIPALEKIAKSKKEYGVAKSHAMAALKKIELKGLGSRSEKINFLAGLLSQPSYSRWASGELLAMRGPDTKAAVQAIADDASNAGRTQAARILKALKEDMP